MVVREYPSPVRPDWALYETEDDQSVEAEVGELLAALIRATKPRTVVEIGTSLGTAAQYMAEALIANGIGRLHTYEIDAERAAEAEDRLGHYGLQVVVHHGDASGRAHEHDAIDFLFVDGDGTRRQQDLYRWARKVEPGGLMCVHDTLKDETTFLHMRQASWPTIWIRSPRGLTIMQKEIEA